MIGASWLLSPQDGWSQQAEPDGPQLRLSFDVDAQAIGCPDESTFRDMVTARLGYDAFSDAQAERSVAVRVEAGERFLLAHVELRDENGALQGARDVEGTLAECEELAQSVALSLSVLIDPLSLVDGPSPTSDPPTVEPAPEPEPVTPRDEPAPEPEPVAPRDEPAPEPEPVAPSDEPAPDVLQPHARELSRPDVGLAVGLAPTVSVGLVPGFSAGGLLSFGVTIGRFSLALEGRVDAQAAQARSVDGHRIFGAVYAGGLTPCVVLPYVAFCGVIHLGAIQGVAHNVSNPEPQVTLFASASARVLARFPLGPVVTLLVLAEAGIPIVRTSLAVNSRIVWTAPPVFGTFGIGVQANVF